MTYSDRPVCARCQLGQHGECADVFVCWCSAHSCPPPDQLTIDDAFDTEENR